MGAVKGRGLWLRSVLLVLRE